MGLGLGSGDAGAGPVRGSPLLAMEKGAKSKHIQTLAQNRGPYNLGALCGRTGPRTALEQIKDLLLLRMLMKLLI